ncbi:hypothetical protein CC78DRAFT_586584 [Lojkania enalia]|uniref:Uncharacterized protein n=1 Tax=Lojkania enalia TaxID=147567 RepID=A0A9P4MVD7_9PLEO|nr:hypothetical protein CC78DRAFT_586584 [Didymosphaeria enalia]
MSPRPVFPNLLQPTAVDDLLVAALIFALLIPTIVFLYVLLTWDFKALIKRKLLYRGRLFILLVSPFVAFGICRAKNAPNLAFLFLLDGTTTEALIIESIQRRIKSFFPSPRASSMLHYHHHHHHLLLLLLLLLAAAVVEFRKI